MPPQQVREDKIDYDAIKLKEFIEQENKKKL
jgi:hypothetical protein